MKALQLWTRPRDLPHFPISNNQYIVIHIGPQMPGHLNIIQKIPVN